MGIRDTAEPSKRAGVRYVIARVLDKFASGARRLMNVPPRLAYSFYRDQNADYRASILLAGSGRAGTTWAAEVINYDNSFRFMFEPFYAARVPQCRVFGEGTYLRPNDDNPIYLAPAQLVFSGRLRNSWVDAYNRVFNVNRRLIKDIRANLLLGWVRRHFPEIPIILILRHPCAVAYSRCVSQWPSDLQATFLSQAPLVEDYLQPFKLVIERAQGEFERHVLSWCIENYVPLAQFRPGEILVTTYEDCVATPETEIERIFEFVHKPFAGVVVRAAKKPSSHSRWNWRSGNASPIVAGGTVVDAWQRSVSHNDLQRALELLKLFRLDAIYGPGAMPASHEIGRFMSTIGKEATPIVASSDPHPLTSGGQGKPDSNDRILNA